MHPGVAKYGTGARSTMGCQFVWHITIGEGTGNTVAEKEGSRRQSNRWGKGKKLE